MCVPVCVCECVCLFKWSLVKPAQPLWIMNWAWLWCRTLKASLLWTNMWKRSDVEAFSGSSCSESTPALWIYSKEFYGKDYSLCSFCSACFWVLMSSFSNVLKMTDWRMFLGCNLSNVTISLFSDGNLKKQIIPLFVRRFTCIERSWQHFNF